MSRKSAALSRSLPTARMLSMSHTCRETSLRSAPRAEQRGELSRNVVVTSTVGVVTKYGRCSRALQRTPHPPCASRLLHGGHASLHATLGVHGAAYATSCFVGDPSALCIVFPTFLPSSAVSTISSSSICWSIACGRSGACLRRRETSASGRPPGGGLEVVRSTRERRGPRGSRRRHLLLRQLDRPQFPRPVIARPPPRPTHRPPRAHHVNDEASPRRVLHQTHLEIPER